MRKINSTFLFRIFIFLFVFSCRYPTATKQANVNEQALHHSYYDDSTLNNNLLPVLMPFNRIISPAGSVIKWGNKNMEQHSLDIKPIPGTHWLAVEERNGIIIIDTQKKDVIAQWNYRDNKPYNKLKSTYSGIFVWQKNNNTYIFWSAANGKESRVLQAKWDGKKIAVINDFELKPEGKSPLALPNEVAVNTENGKDYLYVVLNGNNQLVKLDIATKEIIWKRQTGVAPYGITLLDNKLYVTNWAGPQPPDDTKEETAGVPYGQAYVNPVTGALSRGSVSVYQTDGTFISEIKVGLHPNDIIHSKDHRFIYVSNANSDDISVIDPRTNLVIEDFSVKLFSGEQGFIGDSPGSLVLDDSETKLYVTNGLDNAVAVVQLGSRASATGVGESKVLGFIPTEAYPSGVIIKDNTLYVTNLEGEGARTNSLDIKKEFPSVDVPQTPGGAYNSHKQQATVSVITVPNEEQLAQHTEQVHRLNLVYRADLARLLPRKDVAPKPVPDRIGEPSVFKHVVYIIKENRTYDQVLGDMKEGEGREDLCIFGEKVTPNEHQLARDFLLMDNFHVSGKSSAEGHQWTDAAMVTDYLEKNVGAWFRSYPHVQTDALVYNKKGFLWNNATEHGKTVRIYGEACVPVFDKELTWTKIYEDYIQEKPFQFENKTTISAVRPLLAPDYPGYDSHKINDQMRATAFIKELNEYEKMPGDQLPELMILALPADHTGGTNPALPTPRAMVADNDLALGRILEALTKSRFWQNTVVFVTEDDSQSGWDHVSAYRTTGFVMSPYSRLQKTVRTNYNQTCIVRTIEQILGIPPMNGIDATALPMFDCFNDTPSDFVYHALPNQIPLTEMNPPLSSLKGRDLYYARQSMRPEFEHVDAGKDDLLNRIIWQAMKGKQRYPAKYAGKADDDDDD